MTSTPSVAITSNSANDQFVHFNNSAALSVAAGINTTGASTVVNLNGFINQGLGSITIGAGSIINVANFQSYGTLTLAAGTAQQPTMLVNTGTSPLYFGGGSQTFLGSTMAPNFTSYGIDLHGQNLVIVGGLFQDNGGSIWDSVGGGNIIVGYGGILKGLGYNHGNIITMNGGIAGDELGPIDFTSLVIGPGGLQNYGWQINDARGTGGVYSTQHGALVRGWGQAQAVINYARNITGTGNLTWSATSVVGDQFDMALQTLMAPTPEGGQPVSGLMDNFDPSQQYVWPVITWQGTYSGPTDSATLTADTRFDLNQFQNLHPGTFSMQFDAANQSIDLVYTPNTPSAVPEPGTLALLGAAAGAWSFRRRLAKPRLADAADGGD